VGIGLGAWSCEGEAASLGLAALCVAVALQAAARGRRTAVSRAAGLLFWSAIGFFQGRAAIARPAGSARAVFAELPAVGGRVDRLEGVLTDFWSGTPPRARCRLRAERLRVGGKWRRFPAEVFLFVSGETPAERMAERGDRVALVGRLRAEEPPASDRDVALPFPRYRLSVKSALQIRKIGATPLAFLAFPNRFFYRSLPPPGSRGAGFDRDVRGPLSALLLGRTSELDRGMVARYRRGGLYHLLVVSGLHVGLAAALALIALGAAGIEGKRRDALLLAVVFLFVLVGGANPPAVRAGLVVGFFLSTRLFERPVSAGQAIGVSALVLFLADPKQIYSIGTVLTFAAVGGIALFAAPIRRRLPARPGRIFSGLATALAAECATAPVLFWRFNIVAAGAWLTAPLAVPLSAGLIALGALVLFLFAAGLPAGLPVWLFGLGSRLLELLADRAAGAAFLRPTPPLAAVLLVAGVALAAAAGPRRLRLPAAGLAAALFVALALRPGPAGPQRGFSVEALDVGQGDSILVRWGRRALLVDGGGPFDLEAADFGRTRLLPKLLDRGVTRLDAALLTHPHPDHALGLFAVVEELPVGVVWTSAGKDDGDFHARLAETARSRGVPTRVLASGRTVSWPDALLTVLHSGGRPRKLDSVNNQSVVALFERGGRRALLTGDIGLPTERVLLEAGALRRVDLLKVAHHGSRTSTSAGFVATVRPRLALVSCGRENRFGHPAAETLRTLAEQGVPVLRTDLLSDVRVELGPRATRLSWRGVP